MSAAPRPRLASPPARAGRCALAAAALLACHCAGSAAQSGPILGLGLSSDYVLRGLSLSDGDPAIQGGAAWRFRGGADAAIWLSSTNADWGPEVDYTLGFGRAFGDGWSAHAGLGYYSYPDPETELNYDYVEFSGALSRWDLLGLRVAWSPDTGGFGQRGYTRAAATSTELTAQWPLGPLLSIAAGLGYRDLQASGSYRYWNLGLAAGWRRLSLDLQYIATDGRARQRYGDRRAGPRLVLGLNLSFGEF